MLVRVGRFMVELVYERLAIYEMNTLIFLIWDEIFSFDEHIFFARLQRNFA